ncbi:MAG: Ig-like domain-containing protein, partial [Ilumatobacteraceae bacterium]
PNKAPIARPDKATTRLGRPVTIDVLANDIDPERDTLTISAFGQDTDKAGTITETTSPGSDLQALRYTPPSDVPGNYEFTYQAADPQGGTSQKALVKVTVLADTTPNSPPIANPDALRLRLGVPDTIDVKANDTDPDGDPLTISTKTAPTGVDVVVVGQQLQIKLQPGALKYSVVQYTLSDGMGPTHDQTGKVLVVRIGDSAENRPPVANPDTERVVVGNSVMIPVTANDIDPDNDNIVLLSVDKPVGGVGTTAVSGNSVRFTPNLPDITEPTPVSFGYKITDGRGHDVNGKVTVTVLVQALPRAPFARDDFADTVVGKPVNIDVRANDSDPSGGKPDLLGDPRCNNGGQATTTADQRVTFTPPPDPGTYRCRYTVVNTQGLKAEASIIVAVTAALPGNHAPVIIGSATQRDVNVGGTITFRAGEIANDDDGNPLVFSSVAITQPTHGTTDFSSASPTFTYTAPKVGSPDRVAAVDKVPVVISDGQGGNVPTVISIKINDITPLPTAGPVVHEILRTAASGAPVAIDVLADLLPDNNGATLTLAPASVESGPGTVTTGNGIVSVVTTGPGVVVIGYTVTNASGTPASSKIRVTVLPPVPNDPPVANDDALTVSSGGSGSVDLLANDTGFSDLGDKVTIVLNNRPPAAFGTVTITGSVLTFVAGSDPPGIATLRYTLTDGSGASDDATITLTVLACSESSPSAVPANLFTPYLTPINIDLNSYVVSGHIRAGSVVGAGLKGPTGTYTPPAGMNGNETVTYVVENGCHQTAQGTVTIDVNHSPVGGNISRILDRGNAPLTLTVTELAGDDEPLTITALTGNPAWVTRTSDTTIVAAAPGGTPSGTYTFTATVQDLGGLTATATINLSISNLAPSAIDDAYSTEVTDAVYAIPDPTINDTDPEGGVLAIQTASVISGPATIQTITGKSIAVLLGHGVSTLSYTIVDDGGLTATATITITSNRPPTVPNASGATNGQPTLHVDLDPTEPDGDQLIVSCDAGPNFGIDAITPEPNSGPGSADPTHPKFDLTIRVLHDFTPPATFPCTVTDTFGRSATATVSISVIGN